MSKRAATLADLTGKRSRVKEHTVLIDGEELTLTMRAMSRREYDALVAKFPPTKKQREEGANYNIDGFAPALISASLSAPEISFDDATELWESGTWSMGELMDVFLSCVALNNQGMEVPTTAPA